MRILVVDDEKAIVKGIKFNLESEGFDVDVAYDGIEAVDSVRENKPDLVIMDLMMPGKNGLEACQEIRSFTNTPIIMLTAKSEDTDKIIGFEYGADDYMTKPFNIMELKARVRALIRRSNLVESGRRTEGNIVKGDLRVNTDERSVYLGDKEAELTAKEFDLLILMMRNPAKVFTREILLKKIWGENYSGDERTVDVHVRRLREKVEHDPANPEFIITKWGVGYYFKG